MTHFDKLCLYFIWFILYSFIGWAYESAFYTIQKKRFINTGFLSGPCCPIYGAGAILDVALLGHITNPVMLFLCGIFVNCTLEYFVGLCLERAFNRRWWDYSSWPMNIHGRVCLFGALAFGTLTVILVHYLHPFIFMLTYALSTRTLRLCSAVMLTMLMLDLRRTLINMDGFGEKLEDFERRIYLRIKR